VHTPVKYLLKRKKLKCFQYNQFKWYCKKYFNFLEYLSTNELNYIYKCIDLSDNMRNVSEHLSFYSYSHKVFYDENTIDSSRLAYGLIYNAEKVEEMAKEIAESKNMNMKHFENNNYKFYGFGWDGKERIDKIYFLFNNINYLEKELLTFVNENIKNYAQNGIVSFSYNNGKLIEEKIYLFPLKSYGASSAVMFSKKRKIEQYNNDYIFFNKPLLNKFSKQSVNIINTYKKALNINLCSYAIDKEKKIETLYFDY
jgi:hypothetical protein